MLRRLFVTDKKQSGEQQSRSAPDQGTVFPEIQTFSRFHQDQRQSKHRRHGIHAADTANAEQQIFPYRCFLWKTGNNRQYPPEQHPVKGVLKRIQHVAPCKRREEERSQTEHQNRQTQKRFPQIEYKEEKHRQKHIEAENDPLRDVPTVELIQQPA